MQKIFQIKIARLIIFILFWSAPSFALESVVLGDLEGNYGRLISFFYRNPQSFGLREDGIWFVKEGYRFVFLGDCTDRGNGSIRILKTLLQLKSETPERVHLIAGNREIKSRYKTELSREKLLDPSPDFLQWLSKKNIEITETVLNSRSMRMQYLLEVRMAAKNAFAHRRDEMKILGHTELSDEAVTRNLIADYDFNPQVEMGKNGLLAQYLLQSEVIVLGDNGEVFVHGALLDQNYGKIPGQPKIFVENIYLFVHKINAWFRHKIQIFLTTPLDPSLNELFEFVRPKAGTKRNVESLIYARLVDEEGRINVSEIQTLKKILLNYGYHTIVAGHTPVEVPTLISDESGLFRYLLIDVSHTEMSEAPIVRIQSVHVHIESESKNGDISFTHTLGDPILGKMYEDWRPVALNTQTQSVFFWKVEREGAFYYNRYKVQPIDFLNNSLCKKYFHF